MLKNKKKWARAVIDGLRQEYPQAGTMLKFNSLFELVVAVVLSAQSTDAQVNQVTERLFTKYNTPEQFAALDIDEIAGLVRGVGLNKGKARSIQGISSILLDKHRGQVPEDLDTLMQLPGIGRKSANVIRSVGFGLPGLGVDTHVQRVANRIGLVAQKNPHKTESDLKSLLPSEEWSLAHHLFIYHGRQVCKARRPHCEDCRIADLCEKRIDD